MVIKKLTSENRLVGNPLDALDDTDSHSTTLKTTLKTRCLTHSLSFQTTPEGRRGPLRPEMIIRWSSDDQLIAQITYISCADGTDVRRRWTDEQMNGKAKLRVDFRKTRSVQLLSDWSLGSCFRVQTRQLPKTSSHLLNRDVRIAGFPIAIESSTNDRRFSYP